jgi:hypothetical protein
MVQDGAVLYMFALDSKCEICSGLANDAGLQINNILIIFKEFDLTVKLARKCRCGCC